MLPILLVLAQSTVASAAPPLALDPKLGKPVAECKAASGKTHVWIFKQWHLGASVDTRNSTATAPMPQAANQTSIYEQLAKWVEKKLLTEVYAEGCAGEIREPNKLSFNGWTLADLKEAAGKLNYATVMTHVPLKLEAKFGEQVRTLCGDDPAALKENDLAFSDARGTAGFLTRLVQHKEDPARAKTYLDGVIDLYQLPANTTVPQAIERLKKELKTVIERAKGAIQKRNATLVQTIRTSKETNVAVVFGGMHAAGLVTLLEQAGMGCTVVSPTGYADDEAQLLERLEAAVAKL